MPWPGAGDLSFRGVSDSIWPLFLGYFLSPEGLVRMPVGTTPQQARSRSKSTLVSGVMSAALVVAIAAVALPSTLTGFAREAPVPSATSVVAEPTAKAAAEVSLASLPVQARQTHALILAGGPFPYPHKDGSVFGNRERLLPLHPRGYYREYTVRTPGVNHRGARRIVCGGSRPTTPDHCYYTADHYASFSRIVQ